MDFVIVEVNGVDTRSLSHEQTLSLFANPPPPPTPKSHPPQIDTRPHSSQTESKLSSEGGHRLQGGEEDEQETITIKVLRRKNEQHLNSNGLTSHHGHESTYNIATRPSHHMMRTRTSSHSSPHELTKVSSSPRKLFKNESPFLERKTIKPAVENEPTISTSIAKELTHRLNGDSSADYAGRRQQSPAHDAKTSVEHNRIHSVSSTSSSPSDGGCNRMSHAHRVPPNESRAGDLCDYDSTLSHAINRRSSEKRCSYEQLDSDPSVSLSLSSDADNCPPNPPSPTIRGDHHSTSATEKTNRDLYISGNRRCTATTRKVLKFKKLVVNRVTVCEAMDRGVLTVRGDTSRGVFVDTEKLNSSSTPTSVSGLEAGDQLCQIDGEIVETKSQVTRLLRDSTSARHLEVLVARSNKRVTIEEPPLDERLSSDNTVTSSQSPMKVNSRNRQTAEETLYLNLAEINQLMRNGNSQALMNLADDPLCYQTSCDSTRDPQRSPYRRNPSARPMGSMPLSRQALQNMRQKSFTDDQWHNLPLSDKQKPRLPSGHHKNTQQNCGKYLDIARHGHSSRHGSVYGPIDHYQCHSAPHSPLHHSNDRSSNWEVRQSREKETSKLFDACTNNHFYHDNIPEKGNHGQRHHQHHQNHKYNLMKSSINDTFRRTSEVSAEKKDDHSGRKEKWGSLDCSTRRIRSSTLTGYELMYGRGEGGPEEHQAVRENRVRHASANYSAVKTSADAHDNWTYEDKGFVVPLKSGIRREKTPDREGPRASFSEGRKGEGEKEGGLDRGRLTDEGQKKKIMSNYLVIRALLSTTEGNISEGASHPLLSINKV